MVLEIWLSTILGHGLTLHFTRCGTLKFYTVSLDLSFKKCFKLYSKLFFFFSNFFSTQTFPRCFLVKVFSRCHRQPDSSKANEDLRWHCKQMHSYLPIQPHLPVRCGSWRTPSSFICKSEKYVCSQGTEQVGNVRLEI